jgi:hypothetical protein
MKEVPVFLFNGFLDSGKTTLIKEIVSQTNVYKNYNTLIIATEDGEVEFDKEWALNNQVNVEFMLEDEYDDESYFLYLVDKYKPKQIVIELNAFVDFNDIKLPKNFVIYQEITLFDASKFELYYNNMRPIINRLVQYSTLVVFNRCNDNSNLSKYRRNIRAFNQNCEIAFENNQGKLTTILDEDLPYDINSNNIVIRDEDFPIWYLDITECFEKYKGKTITFRAYIRGANLQTVIVGRQIMTCCEDDIQFYGFECITDEFLHNNSFVEVTCTPVKHYSEIAEADVIMLMAIKIKKLDYIEESYLTFN